MTSEVYDEAARVVDKQIEIECGLTWPSIFEPTERELQVDVYLRDLKIEAEVQAQLARSRLALKVHEIKHLFPSLDGSSPLERAKEMARCVDEMSDEQVNRRLVMIYEDRVLKEEARRRGAYS